MNGGQIAVRNGKTMKSQVQTALESLGFSDKSACRDELQKCGLLASHDRLFVQKVCMGKDIYGADSKSDFYVESEMFTSGAVIECVWQGSPGTVDEKFVFKALSMVELNREVYFVFDGGGARPRALMWLNAFAVTHENFNFVRLADFIDILNKSHS
jgi:hypothetical protein